MTVIDADAHVLETEETWEYMEPSDRKYRPQVRTVSTTRFDEQEFWFIDGKVRRRKPVSLTEQQLLTQSRKIGRNVVTPAEAREMQDVTLRLNHMDKLAIDIEVLHNTIFIERAADSAAAEVAVYRGWNRWMADVWNRGKGRLRWTCMAPTLSLPDALEEIRFGKEHGAVGVILRPIEGERLLVDPYFYPLYEEAVRQDMPIIVHIGNANEKFMTLYSSHDPAPAFGNFMAPTVVLCHQILLSELPVQFPALRWGIIEAGAQWLPWVIGEAERRFQVVGKEWPAEGFSAFGIWVTCQTNNDVRYIMQYSGEDRIVIGTDYGHTDIASEVDAISIFRGVSGLEPHLIEKVLDDNPRALYAI